MPTQTKPLPKPLPLWSLLGPSFLVIATGIGSGEIILWPFLSSQYGLGLAWVALLGITFQYFINMEISRYTLIRGETVFVGIDRWLPSATYWFILSTFLSFAIPGTAAASAQIFAHLFGYSDFRILAIILLLVIGLILSTGTVIYNSLETLNKIIVLATIPAIFIFLLIITQSTDWLELGAGLVGQGSGYTFLPEGIAIATLFGAFAYSGTGGNLNLTQSNYIKEKGYGMGKYDPPLEGLFNKSKIQKSNLDGYDFRLTPANLKKFKAWWWRISLEHLIVFWGIGLVAMLILMMLAAVTSPSPDVGQGVSFILGQGAFITQHFHALLGLGFLAAIAIMLFQSQIGIYDGAARIIAENYAILKTRHNKQPQINLSKIYYTILWSQIVLGIILFSLGYYDPVSLVKLAAIINAISMFVHIGLVNFTNWTTLPKTLQPHILKKALLLIIFTVFGIFSVITLHETLLT